MNNVLLSPTSWFDRVVPYQVRRDDGRPDQPPPRLRRSAEASAKAESVRYERDDDERDDARGASEIDATGVVRDFGPAQEPGRTGVAAAAHVPWLCGPEDSWL
jgi:hypothetical protein